MSESKGRASAVASVAPFLATVFLSAFLLFQVQPMLGKYILPWFGGSASVWTACLLFFQVALLVGYTYAHVVAKWLEPWQPWAHLGIIGASLLAMPISPHGGAWERVAASSPAAGIVALLLVTVGLPYLVLASTGPLLQTWYASVFAGRSPYRLYALSNAGSLLALLTYPVLVEPAMTRAVQLGAWSWGFGAFAVLNAWCAWQVYSRRDGSDRGGSAGVRSVRTMRGADGRSGSKVPRISKPEIQNIVLWLALATTGSSLLMATTNQLTHDIASVPFLWVLPLAIYLVTFIVAFDHERWYDRRAFGPLMVIAVGVAAFTLREGLGFDIQVQVPLYCVALFFCCMVCHGELARRKPDPARLTLFYLVVAAGGALGGFIVAVIAPIVFDGFWEYHLSLTACMALATICWNLDRDRIRSRLGATALFTSLGVATMVLSLVLIIDMEEFREGSIAHSRNFYGTLRVTYEQDVGGSVITLYNGNINHGEQILGGERWMVPTTYYGAKSGVGLALDSHPRRDEGALRVGAVGLGTGTLATYGRPGDVFRFWEINPAVATVARELFTFIDGSSAEVDVVLGDARQRMEEELDHGGAGRYDVLAVDAFTGDAIPIHLLTSECIDLYWSLLAPDGLLVLHISNRYVDLEPIIRAHALRSGAEILIVDSGADERAALTDATWAILVRDGGAFLGQRDAWQVQAEEDRQGRQVLWTDDFASLWPVLTMR